MRAAVLTLRVAALAIGCAAAPSLAQTALYTVVHHGQRSGALKVDAAADRIVSDFSYRDNGRGPDLREEIALRPDGWLLDYRTSGKSEFGAPLGETFVRADGKARWTSPADRGEAPDDPRAVYLPLEGSPAMLALVARQLLDAPDARAAGYPSGRLAARKAGSLRLADAGCAAEVTLVEVTGVETFPLYVWLRDEPMHRLFAEIWPGWRTVVEAGCEAQAKRLTDAQLAAQQELLQALADKVVQRHDGLLVIRDVRVFDAERAKLTPPQDVYINGGRVAALRPPGSKLAATATVIDGRGRTLLPGLFDMHGHLWPWGALLHLAGGVTTVRDLANDNGVLRELIERIDAGRQPGPRIWPAGFIEGAGPHAARHGFVVNTLDEGKTAVDWYAQHGYRQVKLYNSIRPEWARPLAAHAHAQGLRVSGHVPAFMRAEQAVRAGYDEIQHINQVMLNFVVGPNDDTRTLARFTLIGDKAHAVDLDGAPVRRFIALLRERGTTVDPTATAFEASFTQRSGEPNPSFAAIADHLPPAVQRSLRFNSTDLNDGNAVRYRASYEKMLRMVGRLHRAGVPIVAGTDDFPGFALHREFELYVKAGIAPAEVLRIATWNAAKRLGLQHEVGSLAPGKRADAILVDGDPTRDISVIRRIGLVLKDGATIHPAELYEALGIRRFTDPPPRQRIVVDNGH